MHQHLLAAASRLHETAGVHSFMAGKNGQHLFLIAIVALLVLVVMSMFKKAVS